MTGRSAVLAPGGNNSVDVPVLMFARLAVQRRALGPALLVGGTADPYWDGRIASSIAANVIEIDGADHVMVVPGRLAESAALGQVISAVEEFLDQVVWP